VSALRIRAAWQPLTPENVAALGGHMGVYELSEPQGDVVLIGYAGGRSVLGLRGALESILAGAGDRELRFRCEITSTYLSRFRELLMVHVAEQGSLPAENEPLEFELGRLSPS
jgi:hypothetical protein